MWFIKKEKPTYRKWSIIDLWDYLWNFYDDNAQEDPATYGAKYDGPVPADFPNNPDKQAEVTAWRASRAEEVDGVWYWKFSNGKIVSKFYDLIFMWRQDITDWKSQESEYPERKYAKQYIYAQRNYYIISAEAWRVILRERYADFKYMTSYEYNYKTGKRTYYDTIEQAASLLYKTFGAFEHDKIDALTKLMFALRKDYDPVENYDKISEIDLEKKGSESSKFNPTGSETDTLTKTGSETDTLTKSGSEINTETKSGKEKTTDVKGAQEKTHSAMPYDSTANWRGTDKDNSLTYTDTSETEFGSSGTTRQDTDTLTFNQRQDQSTLAFNQRQDTNVKSFTNREDDTWTRYGKTPDGTTDERHDITIEHTHGNIGVTTSQQMILSQFPIEDFDEIEHYTVNEFVHKYLVL